jgi:hypothetical protein
MRRGVPHADRRLAHEGFQRLIVAHDFVERESFEGGRSDRKAKA